MFIWVDLSHRCTSCRVRLSNPITHGHAQPPNIPTKMLDVSATRKVCLYGREQKSTQMSTQRPGGTILKTITRYRQPTEMLLHVEERGTR